MRMSPSDKCTTKVWVCLFTCCTTRGVHIDIVPDLSTVTFLGVSRDLPAEVYDIGQQENL